MIPTIPPPFAFDDGKNCSPALECRLSGKRLLLLFFLIKQYFPGVRGAGQQK